VNSETATLSNRSRGKRLVVFDFDGTLTTRDTFRPFLQSLGPKRAFARALIATVPALIRAVIHRRPIRDEVKSAIIWSVLRGYSSSSYRAAAMFHSRRIANEWLRAGTCDQLQAHRKRGDRVVIVSASLDAYLQPVVREWGVDEIFATSLEETNGLLTGRLLGPNVRGVEKARVVSALRRDDDELWVYGDSKGDAAMMDQADVAVFVRQGSTLPAVDRR
jgi:phosphatidylglycerophosphatase C